METKRALIAMSGGVDSSVSAALMLRQGFECVGVNMKLHTGQIEDGCGGRPAAPPTMPRMPAACAANWA